MSSGGSVNYTNCGTPCGGNVNQAPWIGYIGAVMAIVLFGSNFIPVKKFDTGDGKSGTILKH